MYFNKKYGVKKTFFVQGTQTGMKNYKLVTRPISYSNFILSSYSWL